MSKAKGFSVRIFIPSGDPSAIRVIEKSNWTGQGLAFPRSVYQDVRKRLEGAGSGVYIIWERGESSRLPRVYIGEATSVGARLDVHAKKKDYWTHGVAFTSKDQTLNKAHIQYLEARLLKLAHEAKLCDLENTQTPKVPPLSEQDAADAELFLDDMLLCLPVVEVRFFQKPGDQALTSRPLFLQVNKLKAQGYEDTSGFVVQQGSQAVKTESPSIHAYMSDLRNTLKTNGIFVENGDFDRMTQDYVFSSPSTASGVLLGRPSNGRTEWKDSEGRTLKNIQEEEAD